MKNIRIKKPLTGKKTRIETFNDEFNNEYYNILNPKSPQKTENIENLLKEIEFYKVQFLAEKNINQSLSNEISKLNESKSNQKLSQVNKDENKLLKNLSILEKKNKFLEESVFKLKNTLDRANNLFPNFLLKLESSNNCVPEKEIKELINNSSKNGQELIKLGEENKMLKITMCNMDEIIENLKNENEILNKKLKINEKGEKPEETIISNKVDDCNNRLIEDNKKLKSYINKIQELEDNKIKNEEKIFELISLVKKAEEKMNELEGYNKNANNKIKILNEQKKKDELVIKELIEKINALEKGNSNNEENKINELTRKNIESININNEIIKILNMKIKLKK